MAKVFISYAREDLADATELRGWLTSINHQVFLDHDRSDGISLGESWRSELLGRLRWCDALVCLVSQRFVRSIWCTSELAIASSLGSRILPIALAESVAHPLLDDIQQVQGPVTSVDVQERLAASLAKLDHLGGIGWPEGRSPYPGLGSFGSEFSRVFFGRDAEVRELVRLIRSPHHLTPTFTLLVGPSGCGKSSLLGAGVIPVVTAEADWVSLPTIVPGRDPVQALAAALVKGPTSSGSAVSPVEARVLLETRGLGGLLDTYRSALPACVRNILLPIDQLDELFTHVSHDVQELFLSVLAQAPPGVLHIVATLRSEFLDRMLLLNASRSVEFRPCPIRCLPVDSIREVIEEPARIAGIAIEDGLVERMIEDTGEGDALPLLAYVLAELAADLQDRPSLSLAQYEQLGGVQGALVRQADDAIIEAVASSGSDRTAVLSNLLRLVNIEEDGKPTRLRVLGSEVPESARAHLRPFVQRRLLLVDSEQEEPVILVAHEAFFSAWPPLAQAITSSYRALQARGRVEVSATAWAQNGRRSVDLWERSQLAAAVIDTDAKLIRRRLAGRRAARTSVRATVDLSPRAQDFLATSILVDRRRRRRSTTVLSLLLVIVSVAALTAVWQAQVARAQQERAEARQLATESEVARVHDPRKSLQLALAAERIDPSSTYLSNLTQIVSGTRYAGRVPVQGPATPTAIASSPTLPLLVIGDGNGSSAAWNISDPTAPTPVGADLAGHAKGVTEIAFAADGSLLGIASDDGTVDLYRVTAPDRIERLAPTAAVRAGRSINSLSFSADAAVLATGSLDSTLGLWDIRDPARPTPIGEPIRVQAGGVTTVAFSPTGRVLATGTADDGVLLWDLSDPARPRRTTDYLKGYPDGVHQLLFTPDGRTLVTTTFDDTLVRWDVADPRHPVRLGEPTTGAGGITYAAAVTPDGRYVLSGGSSGLISLWDTADPAQPKKLDPPFVGTGDTIAGLATSRDGRYAFSASTDGQALVWYVDLPAQPDRVPQSAPVHSRSVTVVAAAPDGRSFATGAPDGTIMLWQPRPDGPAVPVQLINYDEGDGPVAMAYSPDSRLLALGSRLGRLSVVDVSDLQRVHTVFAQPGAHPSYLMALQFAPSGQLLATGDEDGTIRLWNVGDPGHVEPASTPLTGHSGGINALRFTPDGRHLLSGSGDTTIGVWEVSASPTGGRNVKFWRSHSRIVNDLALVANGRAVSVADDGRVIIWLLDDPTFGYNASLTFPQTESLPPVGVTTFLGGRLLAIAKRDGSVAFWDMDDPVQPRLLHDSVLAGPTDTSISMAAVGDSQLLVSSPGGSPTIWDIRGLVALMNEATVKSVACTATGGLDREQWTRLVPNVPFLQTC